MKKLLLVILIAIGMINCTNNEEEVLTNRDLTKSFSVNISSIKSRSKIYPSEFGAWTDITDSAHPTTIEWDSDTKTIKFIYDPSYFKVHENCLINGNAISFETLIPLGMNGDKMVVFNGIYFTNSKVVKWESIRGNEVTQRELTIKE